MRIFLTGGTGFLGGHFAELAGAEGALVVALTRSSSRTERLEALGATLCRGDLAGRDALAAGMKGCDAVVHSASPIGGWGPPSLYRKVTVEGTRNIVEAMRIASVPTLVHISTISVHGLDPTKGAPVREDDFPGRELLRFDHYGASKVESERIVRAAHEQGSVKVTVIRPGLMYGPRDENGYGRIADLWRRSFPFRFGGGENRLCLTHVRSVSRAIWTALQKPSADYRVYICASDGRITQNHYLASMARGTGTRRKPVELPVSLLLPASAGLEYLSAVVGYRIPVLPRFVVHLLGSDWQFDQRRVQAELGWAPEIGYEEGFADVEEWYRRTRGLSTS